MAEVEKPQLAPPNRHGACYPQDHNVSPATKEYPMLVTLGGQERQESLVDLLLECHHRIRHFSGVSVKLATLRELNAEEISEGSARCLRYFGEALPLHVEDEERSLLPRLVKVDPKLSKVLCTMKEQHQGHEPLIGRLLEMLTRVQVAPLDQQRRADLRDSAERFSKEIETHLHLEESDIFPLIDGCLSQEAQDEILAELRDRRVDSFRAP